MTSSSRSSPYRSSPSTSLALEWHFRQPSKSPPLRRGPSYSAKHGERLQIQNLQISRFLHLVELRDHPVSPRPQLLLSVLISQVSPGLSCWKIQNGTDLGRGGSWVVDQNRKIMAILARLSQGRSAKNSRCNSGT